MDFKKIKKECPESWSVLESYYGEIDIRGGGYLYWTNPNDEVLIFPYHTFYDFFDEEGLRLTIIPTTTGWYCQLHEMNSSGSLYLSSALVFEIECKKVMVANTRWEAEEAAFTRAFYLLEEKLTK